MKIKTPVIPKKPPYVPKLTKSAILQCTLCKGRYIKTRPHQEFCIKCVIKERDSKK